MRWNSDRFFIYYRNYRQS